MDKNIAKSKIKLAYRITGALSLNFNNHRANFFVHRKNGNKKMEKDAKRVVVVIVIVVDLVVVVFGILFVVLFVVAAVADATLYENQCRIFYLAFELMRTECQ